MTNASLRLKLAASHLLVLLLAVGITVTANYVYFRKSFDQRMLDETQMRARQAALLLDSGQAEEASLNHLAATTPVKFSLISLLAPPLETGSGFLQFPLTLEQTARLRHGRMVSGTNNKGTGDGHFCAVPLADGRRAVVAYAVRMQSPLGKNVASWIARSLLMALLPATLLAALLARHLVRPIKTLQDATERVARGDYTVRSPHANRRDELGAMSRDFDHMTRKLEADARIRTQLLSDLSHELGTPVTTLRITSEALLDGLVDQPAELRRCHQSILRQAEHLTYLVNDVLEMARYETGKIGISKRHFPAPDPLTQAYESSILRADQHGSTLHLEAQPLQALGDPRRILQVLKNLINNAIDHNPPETNIWVSCRACPDATVEYAVEDDGATIPADQRETIFERFTKLDPSRSRPLLGSSGLGLAIVSEILKAHGSRIELVDGARGKCFRFRLQLATLSN